MFKKFRLKYNLTQKQMSLLLGISRSYYGQLERGDKPCPDNVLKKFKSLKRNSYYVVEDVYKGAKAYITLGLFDSENPSLWEKVKFWFMNKFGRY